MLHIAIAAGLILGLVVGLLAFSGTAEAQDKKPNILFIMGDDIGIMNVGAYHQGLMVGETPNIDRLAEESIVFDNAYSEGLPTLPFRNAAFTGKYTLTRKGWAALSAEDQLLSEVLPAIHAVMMNRAP